MAPASLCKVVDSPHSELTARGANVVKPPQNYDYGMRDFDVIDLDGNKLIRYGIPLSRLIAASTQKQEGALQNGMSALPPKATLMRSFECTPRAAQIYRMISLDALGAIVLGAAGRIAHVL